MLRELTRDSVTPCCCKRPKVGADGPGSQRPNLSLGGAQTSPTSAMEEQIILHEEVGCLEQRQSLDTCRSALSTLQGSMDWASWVLSRIAESAEQMCRLKRIMSCGLHVVRDNSGLDAPRECMTQLCRAFKQDHGLDVYLPFLRACDKAAIPQHVLLRLATEEDKGSCCVFADIEDRLPPDARDRLDSLMPSESSSKEEKERAYTSMLQFLMENRSTLFHQHATSYCLVHERECLVSEPVHPRDNDKYPAPLKISFAGTTCVVWSSAGKHERYAHVSERVHAVWLSGRAAKAERDLEDVVFQECVINYPAKEKLREPLWQTHQVLTVRVGPDLHGWPPARPRKFAACINRRRPVLVQVSSCHYTMCRRSGLELLL